ncbi:unnamed protein product [Leuciscus chuanchicus]
MTFERQAEEDGQDAGARAEDNEWYGSDGTEVDWDVEGCAVDNECEWYGSNGRDEDGLDAEGGPEDDEWYGSNGTEVVGRDEEGSAEEEEVVFANRSASREVVLCICCSNC